MWFEHLDKEVEEVNPPEALNALFANMYYYFAATCFMGLIWLLWKVFELRTAVSCNIGLLVVVFGLMVVTVSGLRRVKSWARILLIVNYAALIVGAVAGLILTVLSLMAEFTSAGMIAVSLYLLIVVMCGYGVSLSLSSDAKKINWC